MTTTYRPKWASYKVTKNTPDRLVVDYNPLGYLILGGIMTLLCFYAGISNFPTATLISGTSVIDAHEAINAWLDSSPPTA